MSGIPTDFSKKEDILDILLAQEGYKTGSGFGYGAVINGEFFVRKSILTLDEILKKKGFYKNFFGDILTHNSWVLFHHRKLSVGALDRNNNHPFICDKLMGCHNGNFKNYELIKALLDNNIKYKSKTDSEIGIRLIEKIGVSKFSKLVDNSGVFLLLDKNSNLIAIKTEFSNDLAIAKIDKNKTFLISSLPYNSDIKHDEAKDGFYIFDKSGQLTKFKEKPSNFKTVCCNGDSVTYVNTNPYYNKLPNHYNYRDNISNVNAVNASLREKNINSMTDEEWRAWTSMD